MSGYNWYGHNRRNIHIRAKCGGVGVVDRNKLCADYIVRIADDSTDGILWIQFEDKQCVPNVFYVCVVYLPPENSARDINVHDFFNTIITQIYTIPGGSTLYLRGDWNSRCSDLPDYIEGVDTLQERNIVDFQLNSYGTIFCDFLIDVNCCFLNGPNMLQNDYTFVSTRGCSVVDYYITLYEMLDSFTEFNVTRGTDLVQRIGVADKFNLRWIVPDHSFLTWAMNINFSL